MMMRPPIFPLPPREFFRSEEEYLRARNAHMKAKEERRELDRSDEAMMILVLVIVLGASAVFLFGGLYFLAGWRGPLYSLAVGGLFWVLYEQIKQRLP